MPSRCYQHDASSTLILMVFTTIRVVHHGCDVFLWTVRVKIANYDPNQREVILGIHLYTRLRIVSHWVPRHDEGMRIDNYLNYLCIL